MTERKDVTIQAPVAEASARVFPLAGISHHCPLCKETFSWPDFVAHALGCIAAHPDEVREILGKED